VSQYSNVSLTFDIYTNATKLKSIFKETTLFYTQDPQVYKILPVVAAETPSNLLSHADEIQLAGLVAKGKAAGAKLKKGSKSAAVVARLEKEVLLAEYARTELIARNQGLVGKVARRYFDTGLTHEDLMQEGQLGLIKAVDRYDPKQGTRFSTYAVWWIRQSIGRAVANTGRTIRLPVNLGHKAMQLRRTEMVLAQQLGRDATEAEVAKQLEWTVAQVRDISESVVQVHSLEQIVGSKGEADTELQELLPDDKVMQPEDQVGGDLLKEDIASALNMLSPWEASILRMRFGFLDGEIHPLSDLARKFGLSREGMRQVANRAMEKIRQSRHANGLREYMSN
jgi:RNA polymerase sigma factor (sigma-70 family)